MTEISPPTCLPVCHPRWATPRSTERPTVGPQVAATAQRLLSRQLMPWQAELSDVAGEYDPATGRFVYTDVVVVVPRRAGKTLLTLATLLQRALIRRMVRGWYTAQTREDAARQFRLEWCPLIEPLERRRLLGIRRSNGSETITVVPYRSTVQLFAPTASAIHGQNADIVVVDEVWWFTVDDGADLQAAITPAQLTRPLRQRWWITAGGMRTDASDPDATETFLDGLMDRGRAAVEAGDTAGLCYVEYSADPLEPGYDPYDRALWWQVHPALGHTIDVDALADDARSMSRELFERSVLNVWPRAAGKPGLLPLAVWEALSGPVPVALGRPLWLGVDIAPDRSRAAIVAAGPAGPGVALELVDHQPGADWLIGRLVELHRRHRPAGVVVDGGGPAGTLIPRLERAHLPHEVYGAADYAQACGALVDAVRADRVAVNQHPAFTAAVAAAKSRPLGDAWAWGRRHSAGDITPLVAATLAHRPAELGQAKPQPLVAVSAS